MENYILEKKDGIVTKKGYCKEKSSKDSKEKHLCSMACKNAYANKCEKVFDIRKRKIGKYGFITDGYQVLNEDGDVEKFIVYSCDNYVKLATKSKNSQAEINAKIRKREELRMAYYGANSIEASYNIAKPSSLIRKKK